MVSTVVLPLRTRLARSFDGESIEPIVGLTAGRSGIHVDVGCVHDTDGTRHVRHGTLMDVTDVFRFRIYVSMRFGGGKRVVQAHRRGTDVA